MTAYELRSVGEMIYGRGLLDWVYIRVLARDMGVSERTVHRWWHSRPDTMIPNMTKALDLLVARFNAQNREAEQPT